VRTDAFFSSYRLAFLFFFQGISEALPPFLLFRPERFWPNYRSPFPPVLRCAALFYFFSAKLPLKSPGTPYPFFPVTGGQKAWQWSSGN